MQNVVQTLQKDNELQLFIPRQYAGKELPEYHDNPNKWPVLIHRMINILHLKEKAKDKFYQYRMQHSAFKTQGECWIRAK